MEIAVLFLSMFMIVVSANAIMNEINWKKYTIFQNLIPWIILASGFIVFYIILTGGLK